MATGSGGARRLTISVKIYAPSCRRRALTGISPNRASARTGRTTRPCIIPTRQPDSDLVEEEDTAPDEARGSILFLHKTTYSRSEYLYQVSRPRWRPVRTSSGSVSGQTLCRHQLTPASL